MDRRPSDRVLEEWDSVTRNVQRPAEAPHRRGSFGAMSLVPLAAAALIVAVGVVWLGGRESRPNVGASAAPSPSAAASGAAVAASATTEPASPTPEPCKITAAITSWEGAAGSRIANLTATNTTAGDCVVPVSTRAQLIDRSGRVLAQTPAPNGSGTITLGPGDTIKTMASVSNVCGDPPVAPVTIRLDFRDGRVVTAKPASPDDATVPPCNGPGQPSDMSIQDWAR